MGDERAPTEGIESVEEGALRAVFDPFSGIAGDMVLGCWIDLGLQREWLVDLAERLGIGETTISVERVRRAGLAAVRVAIGPAEEGGDDGHPGRPFSAIRALIEESPLADRSRALALGAFGRLAAAEGRVHGVPPEAVHFHEIGAVDAILDICGAADGMVRLGIDDATTLPVALGRGSVEIAHGTYPVPAPATAYLLEGTTVRPSGYGYETVTPTGAALLAEFCQGRAATEDATVVRVGYGAGAWDPPDHPNCLRVWLTRVDRDGPEAVVVLQTDVDDLSPEYVAGLIEACLEAGALDAVVHTVQMKKGRTGWRLESLVTPDRRAAVEDAVLRHSTTLGLRSWSVRRRTLARRIETRRWRGHVIRVKVREAPGEGRAKPEFEDVAAAAAAEGLEPAALLRTLRREWPDLE